ncbi:MAG: SDR family oxidoreductase [Candidatus Kerfeldbacteria bacterium]|nr:SDR family oxidoreductase [Candidatus Kerfeldbacteria bacterium]
MDLGLNNKTVLVAAASQGLGKAIAEGFTAEGAKVFTCSRHTPIQCDLTNPEQIRQLLETIGPIDVLVTNAGGPKPGTFSAISDADWEATFQLTFMSAIHLIRGVLPHMQQQHWGRIICLTSTSVKQPLDNLITSNAIRAAVANLAKSLANEYGQDGITVNVVAPGMFETDRLQKLIQSRADASGYMFDEEKDILRRTIPVRRFGDPAELAATVVFLASEPGGYINGVSLAVDGGLTKSV